MHHAKNKSVCNILHLQYIYMCVQNQRQNKICIQKYIVFKITLDYVQFCVCVKYIFICVWKVSYFEKYDVYSIISIVG